MLSSCRSGFFTASALIIFTFSMTSNAPAAGINDLKEDIGAGSLSGAYVRPVITGPVIGRVAAINRLNVRISPGGDIIGGFKPGTLVDILAVEGEWYRIRYGTKTAYVHTSLIAVESGTPKAEWPQIAVPATGTVTAKYRLNVRRGPWGEIFDGFKPGTEVDITGCEGEWFIIRHEGGTAYVHRELVRVNGTAAAVNIEKPETQVVPEAPAAHQQEPVMHSEPQTPSGPAVQNKPVEPGGINGPGIPVELMHGLEAAKRSQWLTSHKCLQFAGTVAHEAGAPDGKTTYTQPQSAWPADTNLRGSSIAELPAAVESGRLLPGMLIHVKIHYDKDPAYHRPDDAHHWFVYMGRDEQGVPRFADNTHKGNLQTANDVYRNMKGWENSKKYGDPQYGYIPRITAVHDPFADQR